MEDQVPSSIPPQPNQPIPGQITPEVLEQMKQQARELAIAQHLAQKEKKTYQIGEPILRIDAPVAARLEDFTFNKPQVVYIRRNLTVAELLLIFFLATGIVTGFQAGWKFVSERMPQIEIRMK